VARHVIKQMQQQQEISALGQILLGQNPGSLQSILANVLAGGVMARFSRADEKQADDMGLQFMYDANFSPQGMLDFFQKLLALDSSHPGSVSRFFQDHPGTQDRISDIQGRLAKLPPKPNAITDEAEFHNAKSALGM
jgi:predicted Zn-dependent protease